MDPDSHDCVVVPLVNGELCAAYDEAEIKTRLDELDRAHKTAFAAACAERLWPLFERYSRVTGQGDVTALRAVLDGASSAVQGEEVVSLVEAQEVAEGMAPSDEGEWVFEMGYGQNAAAAVAYVAGGNPDLWRNYMQDLAGRPVTNTLKGGIEDIIGTFPKAVGSGTFQFGIRIAPSSNGSYDLVTLLTRQ